MAFLTSIARWLQGGMASDVSLQLLAQSGNTAITIPSSGSFWPGNPRAGYIRVKQATLGTNGTAKIGNITATDGSNIATVYAGDNQYSANGRFIDASFFFHYDWEVTNLNLNVWTGNADSTFDVEVVGLR